jgi:coenzyme PQQ precursor peptide PqqA
LAPPFVKLRLAGCCASLLWSKNDQGLSKAAHGEDMTMAWTSPTLVEICVGLEINGYLPAEY